VFPRDYYRLFLFLFKFPYKSSSVLYAFTASMSTFFFSMSEIIIIYKKFAKRVFPFWNRCDIVGLTFEEKEEEIYGSKNKAGDGR
jgi:hypothetical protein